MGWGQTRHRRAFDYAASVATASTTPLVACCLHGNTLITNDFHNSECYVGR